MKHTIVLTEPLPAAGMALLAARPDVAVHTLPAPTQSALMQSIALADGVVMVMETPLLDAAAIDRAPRLRVACRMGAGYDNFDVAALTRRGIPLATTGTANADTVAEHALYLMLALAKRGPWLDRAVKHGTWPRGFGALELRDRTCSIIGFGRIGQKIAPRAAAFAMRIVVFDPGVADAHILDAGCVPAHSLSEALAQGDFIVIACGMSASTRGLINATTLEHCKSTAFLINIARGPIVEERAVLAALAAGRLAGAGLDVLETEPPSADNPLLMRDDVVLTPHTAAYIDTAFNRMAVACARNVLAGVDGRLDLAVVVNAEALAGNPSRFARS
ncbi:MAG: NAD(P)-dependent oxidoreductase [Burkholderiales bacterium]